MAEARLLRSGIPNLHMTHCETRPKPRTSKSAGDGSLRAYPTLLSSSRLRKGVNVTNNVSMLMLDNDTPRPHDY
jgi:hypothetical protein